MQLYALEQELNLWLYNSGAAMCLVNTQSRQLQKLQNRMLELS
jgi:hypothetical protein